MKKTVLYGSERRRFNAKYLSCEIACSKIQKEYVFPSGAALDDWIITCRFSAAVYASCRFCTLCVYYH